MTKQTEFLHNSRHGGSIPLTRSHRRKRGQCSKYVTSREVNPAVELASGEYDLAKQEAREKGQPHAVTVPIAEKRAGLRKHALRDYRANYISRKSRVWSSHAQDRLPSIRKLKAEVAKV